MYDPEWLFVPIFVYMHTLTDTHASLPLSQRLTLIPEYTLTQTGVLCQEQRVFPFGSLCAELTFIPREADAVLVGRGQKCSHSCPEGF